MTELATGSRWTDRFTSDGLGIPAFPVGTAQISDLGDHIMGIVVLAWLSQHPLHAWGTEWARSGSIDVRFRSHLTAGLAMTTTISCGADDMSLSVVAPDGAVAATATARRPAGEPQPSKTTSDPARRPVKLSPEPSGLRGRPLNPTAFDFLASRDLSFTHGMADGEIWRANGWAHPSWLAGGTNAMIRDSIDFGVPGHWTHAGMSHRQLAPIEDGSTVTLTGHIDSLFDRGRNRFAVAAIDVSADGRPAAVLRNTFVYDPPPNETAG